MMKTIENYTYKINENIGKGYSSTVHKGVNDKNGHPVSIKVIEMIKLEDPINQMLLQHQIMALKALANSPYVLHLYDVYATKNNTYIITQLCDGDLGSVLKKRKAIPYPEAVEILEQIIKGYIDVNNSGYLHRDIKPANIFYRGSSYKIGDFGFAIPRQELDNHKNYNVGSPVYMPPQALKDNIYSVSCDTWAIGIIFYQILKGVVPWRAVSQQKLHQKLITQPLDSLTIGLPEVARQYLSKVLCLDPKNRMNIEEMHNWCPRLASVQIIKHPQYHPQPLRQIKNQNQNFMTGPVPKNDCKPFLTPKQNSGNHGLKFQVIPPPPTQKYTQKVYFGNQHYSPKKEIRHEHKSSQLDIEETLLKQAGGLAGNMVNYIKFLHKVINFVSNCSKVNTDALTEVLKKNLLEQIQLFESFIANPSSCIIDRWEQYLESSKGQQFKKKFNKSKMKYRMMHSEQNTTTNELSDSSIKECLKIFLDKMDTGQISSKMIVGADYLTTMFQLWHLRNKYGLIEFFKMSKIDLIVQGEPYNASPEHLGQLRRKISLIDVFN